MTIAAREKPKSPTFLATLPLLSFARTNAHLFHLAHITHSLIILFFFHSPFVIFISFFSASTLHRTTLTISYLSYVLVGSDSQSRCAVSLFALLHSPIFPLPYFLTYFPLPFLPSPSYISLHILIPSLFLSLTYISTTLFPHFLISSTLSLITFSPHHILFTHHTLSLLFPFHPPTPLSPPSTHSIFSSNSISYHHLPSLLPVNHQITSTTPPHITPSSSSPPHYHI